MHLRHSPESIKVIQLMKCVFLQTVYDVCHHFRDKFLKIMIPRPPALESPRELVKSVDFWVRAKIGCSQLQIREKLNSK